jgi:hypothetical protein
LTPRVRVQRREASSRESRFPVVFHKPSEEFNGLDEFSGEERFVAGSGVHGYRVKRQPIALRNSQYRQSVTPIPKRRYQRKPSPTLVNQKADRDRF